MSITAEAKLPTLEYWGSAEQVMWEGPQFFCDECGCGRDYIRRRAEELGILPDTAICCEVANG